MKVIDRIENHARYHNYLFSAMVDGAPTVLCTEHILHAPPPSDDPLWQCEIIKGEVEPDEQICTVEQARRVLKYTSYVGYEPGDLDPATGIGICLDGDFSLVELRAIVWWLENRPNERLPYWRNV